MDKSKQKTLITWLKQQSAPAQRPLRLLMLLSVLTSLVIIAQAGLMASLLQQLIMEKVPRETLFGEFLLLIVTILCKALLTLLRERIGFECGKRVRSALRQQVLSKLEQLGPMWIHDRPVGHWATIILEQIENMQDYYARYLPQMYLAMTIPVAIVLTILPFNWAAALILLCTAPLIPLFMIMVGMGAADANRRNFIALGRLGGYFLDRLKGLDTLRLFYRAEPETQHIAQAAEDFRQRTMDVLKLAFLSSAVLEFFAAVSIAIVAVYFGFSYLGEFHFGSYGLPVTLGAGFLALILAPEFFQPLRDLGTFYHAKAQAAGAAEALLSLLQTEPKTHADEEHPFTAEGSITLCARDLEVFSSQGTRLLGPISFRVEAGQSVAIVGPSGAGKSSLLNAILGFLPYQGSLTVNGEELNTLSLADWRQHLSWLGQNPRLPAETIRQNLLLGHRDTDTQYLEAVLDQAHVNEFLEQFPEGLDTQVGDYSARLSVGQAQRIALARALLRPAGLLLLDEPTASLDAKSEQLIMETLSSALQQQTTLFITHRLEETRQFDQIWVIHQGQLVQQGNYVTLSRDPHGLFASLLAHRTGEF